MNDALHIIKTRYSCRKYTGNSISSNDIMTLLEAAMSAPTAVNCQPWDFIVVTEREVLSLFAAQLPYSRMLLKAGAAIVVCGNLKKALPGIDAEYWIQDCSAASQNILLAAHALGLGAVWNAIYPHEERMKIIREVFRYPDFIVPLALIPIGVPAETEEPKDKFNPTNIHWNHWDGGLK
jgi:nitroreductase